MRRQDLCLPGDELVESNTAQERANVIGLVSGEPDAKMLLQMLGIAPTPALQPMCEVHSWPKRFRSDGKGWVCNRCKHSGRGV